MVTLLENFEETAPQVRRRTNSVGTSIVSYLNYSSTKYVQHGSIAHAIDLNAGQFVVLKKTDLIEHPDEIRTMEHLSEEPVGSDKRNHSVRAVDVLEHPTEETTRILVLPLLRDFDDPPFETVGEILDFIWQLLEVGIARSAVCVTYSPMFSCRVSRFCTKIRLFMGNPTSHHTKPKLIFFLSQGH